jgi:hypothetical protein
MRSFQGKTFDYLPSASLRLWQEFKPAKDQLTGLVYQKKKGKITILFFGFTGDRIF